LQISREVQRGDASVDRRNAGSSYRATTEAPYYRRSCRKGNGWSKTQSNAEAVMNPLTLILILIVLFVLLGGGFGYYHHW
jgi:hypothetical protein